MRLTIRHHTEYLYDRAVPYALQRLRLVPRDDAGQSVTSWTLDITGGLVEARYVDGYGNETWLVSARDGTDHLSIEAAGVVETRDTSGVLGINKGPAPLWLFVGSTPLSEPDDAIRALAGESGGRGDLDGLHALMGLIADVLVFDDKVIKAKPTEITGIMKAYLDGMAYMKSKPDEAAKIIGKFMGVSAKEVKEQMSGVYNIPLAEMPKAFLPAKETTSYYASGEVIAQLLKAKGQISAIPATEATMDASLVKTLAK